MTNISQQQVLCTNPRIILHPLAGEFISRFGCYVYDGRLYELNRRQAYFEKTVKRLKPRLVPAPLPEDPRPSDFLTRKSVCSVTDEIFDNSYFLDRSTGEMFPMYLKTRCGHCDNCKKSKVDSLVHRCKLESMSYKCLPIFLTLTYDEEHLPKDGLCVRDVQLFFKRLRINLQRHGYSDKIRYLLVGEYGKTTHRAHYHAILWNCHQTDILSYRQIGDIIKTSWSNGFTMHRLVDLVNDKAFYYTSKYLGKDSVVPEGKNKTFILSSNRGGAIGALFLASLAPEIRKTLNTDPKFVNHFSGKVEHLQMSKYVLDHLFPSFCRSITSKVRSAVKRFVCNYAALRTYENDMPEYRNLFQFDSSYEKCIDYFTRFMYIYHPATVSLSLMKPYNQVLRELVDDGRIIDAFIEKHGYLYDPLDLDTKRRIYLAKFFTNKPLVDLDKRARDFRRTVDYLSQFEIF